MALPSVMLVGLDSASTAVIHKCQFSQLLYPNRRAHTENDINFSLRLDPWKKWNTLAGEATINHVQIGVRGAVSGLLRMVEWVWNSAIRAGLDVGCTESSLNQSIQLVDGKRTVAFCGGSCALILCGLLAWTSHLGFSSDRP